MAHFPTVFIALAGLLLDRLLGEPKRWHPLVGFGRLAEAAERLLRKDAPGHAVGNRLRGLVAWGVAVLPSARKPPPGAARTRDP